MILGTVVQFNENHKWCGCLGIVTEVKKLKDCTRFMIGVPTPEKGTAYIFVTNRDQALEVIGQAVFVDSDLRDTLYETYGFDSEAQNG